MVTGGPITSADRGRVFIPIPVADLELDVELDFDLYVRSHSGHSAYLQAGSTVHPGTVRGLAEAGVETLYVTLVGAPKYTVHAVERARTVLLDQLAEPEARARAMRTAIGAVAQELAAEPTPATIQASQRIVEMVVGEVLGTEASLAALLRMTYVSYELRSHMVNCAVYALAMCEPLGIKSPPDICAMGMAGLLFDLGLAGFGRSGPLRAAALEGGEDPSDRQHPERGRNLLSSVPGMPRPAMDAALHHHERWDGSGYPAGLRGVRIPLAGRVAAVIDTFDAMMTEGAIGRTRGSFAVLQQMRDKGRGQFDPDVLRGLIAGLGVGSGR